MKNIKNYLVLVFLLLSFCLAVTRLGSIYVVFRDNSPYDAIEGDQNIKILAKGTKVRLIKDESMAEMVIWAPVRIIKLMFTIVPHGNWLVEDEKGNRGYMWDSDLQLLENK